MKVGLRTLAVAAISILLGCHTARSIAAQRDAAEGSFERALSVSGAVDLDVSTGSGRIEVREGPAGRVQVSGTIRVGDSWRRYRRADELIRELEANPPVEQSGGSIRIGRLNDPAYRNNVSISYSIVVPSNTRVRAHTGSGTITVRGVNSEVDVDTGSGRIELTDIAASVKAKTGSGSIVGGSIRGGFIASTGSGRITVDGEPTGTWNISTGSGSVDLRLPQQAAFDLYAHTGSGRISVDHPLTVQGRIGRRNELSGKVRGGGVSLDVRTGSGSIRIE